MKGFTLIELLAVLALLAVVAVIAVTNGMSILNSSKNSLSETQTETIIDAAKNYQAAESTNENDYVSLDDLSEKGYLDSSELTDPKTKDPLTGGVCIKHITEEDGQKIDKYNFEYDAAFESVDDCK